MSTQGCRRVTLWIISGGLGIALISAIITSQAALVPGILIAIAGIAHKLIESEEKG